MKKWLSIFLLVFTAACGGVPEEQLAADGKPLPKFYDLATVDAATLQFRMLDA
ncbi:MAG: CAP domain-containing protein, partial [Rhodobacteraceae bacterium]|nr:CAP domain-containing protein [Paracoccaceae bacterium]